MKEFLDFLAKDFPEGNKLDGSVIVGYGVAQTLVQVLKQCGDDLTRENVMKQAANLKNFRTEVLLPGVDDQHQPDRFRADQPASAGTVQGREVGAVRRRHLGRRRRLIAFADRPIKTSNALARLALAGVFFCGNGWITGIPCFRLGFLPGHDRPTPSVARDFRCRGRRRASRCRAGCASAPRPQGQGDLSCRRQGRRRHGGRRRAALSRRARARSVAPDRHRHHPPRPWRADAADQGDRGRPSDAGRGRA